MTDDNLERAQLLPCPFCGGTNVSSDCNGPEDFDVTCWDCQAGNFFSIGPNGKTREEAIAAWNKRAALDTPNDALDWQAVQLETRRWAGRYVDEADVKAVLKGIATIQVSSR